MVSVTCSGGNGVRASHVAIIMDGNGRWAQQHGLPRLQGHREGAETAKRIALAAKDMGLDYLTLFAFSSENWKRPRLEVQGLFKLLEQFFARETRELARAGVRIRVLGDVEALPQAIRAVIREAERLSVESVGTTVSIALNYGGRWDIVQAARTLASRVSRGELDPERIDERLFASVLSTGEQPDPDLLIRTGGDLRISNFLLWQCAYAELSVVPVLWPDFTAAHLQAALDEFCTRERRFGAITEQPDGGEGV